MEITQHCVVGLTWTLKDTLGEVLDELDNPIEFLVGGDDLLAKIEEALQGHRVGDKIDLHLEPEEAFGDYDENLVFLEARSRFPKELEEGHTVEGDVEMESLGPDHYRTTMHMKTDQGAMDMVSEGQKIGGKKWHADFEKLRAEVIPDFDPNILTAPASQPVVQK